MKFTKDEISHYNIQFNNIFKDYCAENDLGLQFTEEADKPSFQSFYLVYKYIYKEPNMRMLDSKTYFQDHLFFDDKLKIISPLRISEASEKYVKPDLFWEYADKKLDIKGQILFHRIINNSLESKFFEKIITIRTDEQNWFYMKHIHDGSKKSVSLEDFKIFFEFFKRKERYGKYTPELEENINTFYILCKHSDKALKDLKYNSAVSNYVYYNLPKPHHAKFGNLLHQAIEYNTKIQSTDDIFQYSPSLTITLDRNTCFEKFQLSSEVIKNKNSYSAFHDSIIRGLRANCMEQLGLKDINIAFFCSETNKEKITFEFKNEKFKEYIPDIFMKLLTVCAPLFDFNDSNNSSSIANAVKITVDHFFLKQSLNKITDKKDSPRIKI